MAEGTHRPADVRTLIFDVMGTVVDIEGSIAAQATAALRGSGLGRHGIDRLLQDWEGRLDRGMQEITAGTAPWRSHRDLRSAALHPALAAAGIDDLPANAVEELTTVVHRLDAWPDSADALALLRTSTTVVALSNADVAELVDLSAHAGLAWHGLLSAEFVRTYKPDGAVYRMALEMLGVDPAQVMMVAAHPWDLRAAAEHGFATAYIGRPGAEPPGADDTFDLHADDLHHLAEQLTSRP